MFHFVTDQDGSNHGYSQNTLISPAGSYSQDSMLSPAGSSIHHVATPRGDSLLSPADSARGFSQHDTLISPSGSSRDARMGIIPEATGNQGGGFATDFHVQKGQYLDALRPESVQQLEVALENEFGGGKCLLCFQSICYLFVKAAGGAGHGFSCVDAPEYLNVYFS